LCGGITYMESSRVRLLRNQNVFSSGNWLLAMYVD
jgi:hypothetical protein